MDFTFKVERIDGGNYEVTTDFTDEKWVADQAWQALTGFLINLSIGGIMKKATLQDMNEKMSFLVGLPKGEILQDKDVAEQRERMIKKYGLN